MKSIFKILPLTFALIALFIQCEKEDPFVNIPDNNFLSALIEEGVDTDGDGQISNAEAEAVTFLDVSAKFIYDLTGIEKFVNLELLLCGSNQLTNLDVSNNTALIELGCGGNQLTSLNISNNTALTGIGCYGNRITSLDVSNNAALMSLVCWANQLTSLDVSNNTALISLICDDNQLSSLDVSKNTALTRLFCNKNQLTSLDVSNNAALIGLWCNNNQLTILDISNNTSIRDCGPYCAGGLQLRSMPTLSEVCVWTMPFPPEDVSVDTTGSPNIYFTTECSQ